MTKSTEAMPQAGFVEAFLRHQRSIHAFILQFVHDYNDADDLLQRTGLVIWRKFDQYEPGTDFLAWARQIAKFEVLSYLKAASRSRVCFSTETIELLADESDEVDASESHHDALRLCLEGLRSTDRELVRRCYEAHGTIQQVAIEIGRSADGVYHSLHRIRQALLRCIDRRITEAAR